MTKPKHTHVDPNNADHVIRQDYEGEDVQQEGAFPADTLASVSTADPQPSDATLYGGDIDAAQHQTDAGEEAVGGSSPTPDQDVVQELGMPWGSHMRTMSLFGSAIKWQIAIPSDGN